MRVSIGEHPRDSFTEPWGGISRTCKCDDDLTILEVVYEDNGQIQFPDSV